MFAALIALSGVPADDAQARHAAPRPAHATPALADASAGSAAPAAFGQAAPSEAAGPSTAAQGAAGQPVEQSADRPAGQAVAEHAGQPAGAASVESGHQQPAPGATPAADAAPTAGAPAHDAPGAPAAGDAAHGQPQAHGPPAAGDHGAEGADHGASSHEEAESIWSIPARIFNFAVLIGGLVYFLRGPLGDYLAGRRQQIRGGLEAARETSDKATAQLAELDRRLQALPAELEALRTKGVEEIAAEERRIQAKAEAERARLIEDMQRDVDVRVRVARKALAEHAADLAVGLAADRVRQTITDADQVRLIDRYTDQVKDIHG